MLQPQKQNKFCKVKFKMNNKQYLLKSWTGKRWGCIQIKKICEE